MSKQPKRIKPIVISLLIIAAVVLGLYAFKNQKKPQAQQASLAVTVAKTSIQELNDSVEALGNTIANESISITSNVTETINSIEFTEGQQVKKGDILVTMEQAEEAAQLRAAQAQLQEHQRELTRLGKLVASNVGTRREYDERKTMLEVTQQNIEEIEARIADRNLRAPFDGIVGIRRLSVGALVQPGQVITTLDDIYQMKLDFNVPDIYLSQLIPGTSIEVHSPSLDSQLFKGAIETIDTRIDPVTRSVLVRATIPNPDGVIKPGLLMQVTLLKNNRQALIVPEEAILQMQDKHYVMHVDESTKQVEQKQVKIGTRKPGIVEITEGLQESDLVIVRGLNRVQPGQKVEFKEVWEGPKTNSE